jgi:hypothetical protein
LFYSVKFAGRAEDFKIFRLHYNAEKALRADDFTNWSEAQCIVFLTSTVKDEV